MLYIHLCVLIERNQPIKWLPKGHCTEVEWKANLSISPQSLLALDIYLYVFVYLKLPWLDICECICVCICIWSCPGYPWMYIYLYMYLKFPWISLNMYLYICIWSCIEIFKQPTCDMFMWICWKSLFAYTWAVFLQYVSTRSLRAPPGPDF